VHQDLAAVLMAAGNARHAERAYRKDLARFPNNTWSLAGLETALREQGKRAQADKVQRELARVLDH
jgi:cytochrome c-type biogenesis protein CcmH/NrfG